MAKPITVLKIHFFLKQFLRLFNQGPFDGSLVPMLCTSDTPVKPIPNTMDVIFASILRITAFSFFGTNMLYCYYYLAPVQAFTSQESLFLAGTSDSPDTIENV